MGPGGRGCELPWEQSNQATVGQNRQHCKDQIGAMGWGAVICGLSYAVKKYQVVAFTANKTMESVILGFLTNSLAISLSVYAMKLEVDLKSL